MTTPWRNYQLYLVINSDPNPDPDPACIFIQNSILIYFRDDVSSQHLSIRVPLFHKKSDISFTVQFKSINTSWVITCATTHRQKGTVIAWEYTTFQNASWVFTHMQKWSGLMWPLWLLIVFQSINLCSYYLLDWSSEFGGVSTCILRDEDEQVSCVNTYTIATMATIGCG